MLNNDNSKTYLLNKGLNCASGYIAATWQNYMSSWIFSIPKEETETSLNECWKIAQQNNPDIFGVYWSYGVGKCRGIVKTVGLLPWPTKFPDSQSSAKLCLLEDLAGKYTHSTNSSKSSLFLRIFIYTQI